jgi:hypothetical protein
MKRGSKRLVLVSVQEGVDAVLLRPCKDRSGIQWSAAGMRFGERLYPRHRKQVMMQRKEFHARMLGILSHGLGSGLELLGADESCSRPRLALKESGIEAKNVYV